MSTNTSEVAASPKFGIQVRQYDRGINAMAWTWVHPSNEAPYQFESKAKAERMRDICYPMCDQSQVRVYPFEQVTGVH